MSGPDHSPWKPSHADAQSNDAPSAGEPSRPQAPTPPQPPPGAPGQDPPPPGGSPPGPWNATGRDRQGPWRAPVNEQPGSARPTESDPPRTNLPGAISLVLALVGIAMSLYPPIIAFGWLTLLIALILGVIALFPRGLKKGLAIAGIVTSLVGFVVALAFTILYGGAMLWGLYLFSTAPPT